MNVSQISVNQHVVFFRTTAWLDLVSNTWQVPIHGWVYEPQNSRYRKNTFAKVLASKYHLFVDENNKENFNARVNLLIADNKRGKRIVINIKGAMYTLPVSSSNGHFETILSIPALVFEASDPLVQFHAVTTEDDVRAFTGEFLLLFPKGKSVISDIDDTIKISEVTNRKALLENTFFNNFLPILGMVELYKKWCQQGYSFHYVSSSPWHLYEPLIDFLVHYQFPWASLNLKKIRFKDSTLLDLFKKGTKTKPLVIESILQSYPQRSFILVGDSGEKDAAVYAGIALQYPHQIDYIFIRNVNSSIIDIEKYNDIFSNVIVPWKVISSVEEITI